MRRRRLGIVTMALAIIVLSLLSFNRTTVAQPYPSISGTVAREYVNNLLTNYNALITSDYGVHPSSTVTDYFQLYHAVGYSFNVTVMKWDNNTDYPFFGFVFIPILSNSLLVTVNNDTTACDYVLSSPGFPPPDAAACSAFQLRPDNDLGVVMPQAAGNGTYGASTSPFLWLANATTLYANPLASSAQAGQLLFQDDQRAYVPPPTPTLLDQLVSFIQTYIIIWLFGIVGAVAGAAYLYDRRKGHHGVRPARKASKKPKHKAHIAMMNRSQPSLSRRFTLSFRSPISS